MPAITHENYIVARVDGKVDSVQKLHDFGDPDIDHWTTLEVNLVAWDAERRGQGGS